MRTCACMFIMHWAIEGRTIHVHCTRGEQQHCYYFNVFLFGRMWEAIIILSTYFLQQLAHRSIVTIFRIWWSMVYNTYNDMISPIKLWCLFIKLRCKTKHNRCLPSFSLCWWWCISKQECLQTHEFVVCGVYQKPFAQTMTYEPIDTLTLHNMRYIWSATLSNQQ